MLWCELEGGTNCFDAFRKVSYELICELSEFRRAISTQRCGRPILPQTVDFIFKHAR